MKPVYIDLHIHTSENPNSLNTNYNVELLLDKVRGIAKGNEFLISLTDHNTINKNAYARLLAIEKNILLGVELHVKYRPDTVPYHAHIFFNVPEISAEWIDQINSILDELYPEKVIIGKDTDTPSVEDIMNAFDAFDFLLLPHGGQSHSTFDMAIPHGARFDSTMERIIYYNQIDGFTARGKAGQERTKQYFDRLGISAFTNLITCSDNYNPETYPNAKAADAAPFIPTWMLAMPTFDGLRLSLSESSRLVYGAIPPETCCEYIRKVKLDNELISIDVNLTPGLNVVIGGSSSGKTLFVDSIDRKLNGHTQESVYSKFSVDDVLIDNPSQHKPHYIPQNYITQIISNEKMPIDNIDIIKTVFKGDLELDERIRIILRQLSDNLDKMIGAVKAIDESEQSIEHIRVFTRLIICGAERTNVFNCMLPSRNIINKITYSNEKHEQDKMILIEMQTFINNNPFTESQDEAFEKIVLELNRAYEKGLFEAQIRKVIAEKKAEIETYFSTESRSQEIKKTDLETLLENIGRYSQALKDFNTALSSISGLSFTQQSQEIESMGHKLYIENKFELSQEKVLSAINDFLKAQYLISEYGNITPKSLIKSKFKERPIVGDYAGFKEKVYTRLCNMNIKKYRIIANDGRDFDTMSAGWKTSVLLDLILGYHNDSAPLIIDQPEDNLANSYINNGLISAIKDTKCKKQIILVSHNATIPMLGDAQNIVLCENNGKIFIRSARLEDKIDNKTVVDYIAEITDGGKPSIKKRVKKYNLKKFVSD